MKLRKEVLDTDRAGDERVVSWRRATGEWRNWYDESTKSSIILTDQDSGDELEIPATNRFMPSENKKLYAKLSDLERGVDAAYGDSLSTAMLTFSASAMSGAGRWNRCPANHLDDLLGSWSAIRRELARALDGRDWEYLRILEPHKGGSGDVSASGYAHMHVAVFVRGPVPPSLFEPTLDAHVRNCMPASADAHTVDRAVEVHNSVGNLPAYLSKYLMKWSDGDGDADPLEAPEHIQRFHALLWATGRRRWSVSQGAQEWVSSPETEPSDRELAPTHFEIKEERYPLSDRDRAPLMRRIEGAPGLDPPPDR
jgi:hypothetical protein